MSFFVFVLELIGTAAFAVSGAFLALRKEMDIFGICIMGIVTACGGGITRDLFLGKLPPIMFREPIYALIAVIMSILIFIPFFRAPLDKHERHMDLILLISDSIGLGIFTAAGVSSAIHAGYADNLFFSVFLGTVTGVGGGVIRDILAGNRPYILVKHIYACASISGAILCFLLWPAVGKGASIMISYVFIFIIRLLAAHYRWSLPKAKSQ